MTQKKTRIRIEGSAYAEIHQAVTTIEAICQTLNWRHVTEMQARYDAMTAAQQRDAARDAALERVDAKATSETIRAERAISQRIPKRKAPSVVTHAVAFALGGVASALTIFAMHLLY